jgi:hypothetical protein
MLQSMLLALGIAMAISGLTGWLVFRRGMAPGWSAAGSVVGVAVGFAVGCWWLGIRPHWPPREDQDRFLLLVLPAVVLVELLATWNAVPARLVAAARVAILCLTGRVLLDGTSYLADLSGPGSREWSPLAAWLILGGLAVWLSATWVLMARLTERSGGVSAVLALAGVIAASALTIMFSGYASGGQIGLPMAAGLAGVTLASAILPAGGRPKLPVELGVVGLFGLLVLGRFFGRLTTPHAVLLFAAPLLAWVPELPYLVRLPGWTRGLARLGVVASVALTVLFLAQREFVAASAASSSSTVPGGSAEDYMGLGK